MQQLTATLPDSASDSTSLGWQRLGFRKIYDQRLRIGDRPDGEKLPGRSLARIVMTIQFHSATLNFGLNC
jgi:hypothetical protein